MNDMNGVTGIARTTTTGEGNGHRPAQFADVQSWYEAMAKAWGSSVDQQASKVTTLSESIANGGMDNPSTITLLTAESLRMQFLSNNASTAIKSVGEALESLARK